MGAEADDMVTVHDGIDRDLLMQACLPFSGSSPTVQYHIGLGSKTSLLLNDVL